MGARPAGAVGEADPLTLLPRACRTRRIVGVVTSMFAPGFGHLLVGYTARGAAWLAVQLVLVPAALLALFLVEWSGLGVRPALMLAIVLITLLLGLSFHVGAPVDLARLPAREAPRLRTTVLALAVAAVAFGALAATAHQTSIAVFRGRYVEGFRLPSESMAPAVLSGDRFLASRFVYRLREPTRGDVVVFKYPPDEQRTFLKRVIGLPGEDLYIEDRRIYVNCRPPDAGCQPIGDPWGRYGDRVTGRREKFGPLRVPPGSYFVLGDNRDNSQDSRYWGFLRREKVMGQALLVYWSWDPEREGVRWGRLGQLVQ